VTAPRPKRVVVYLSDDEFAILEAKAHDDERDPFQHARYLLVGLLRRHVEEAPATAELTPSTAAD
jgi:hypothetical protein